MIKKNWNLALAGITVWAAMALAAVGLNMTRLSLAAQNSYTCTTIAQFPPSPDELDGPSGVAEAPVIANDGTVVYSVGDHTGLFHSSIYSSDGISTRLLAGPIEHHTFPLTVSVSGNGLMATNLGAIIDVHDGAFVGGFGGGGFTIGGGFLTSIANLSINNDGDVAFTGGVDQQCPAVGPNFVTNEAGVFRDDGETTTIIAMLGSDNREGANLAYPSLNERGQVAFLVQGLGQFCPVTPGISGGVWIGDGIQLTKIAEAQSAPSLNNRGEVGFIGVTNGLLSIA